MLASRRAARAAAVDGRIAILEKEASEADERLRRLYRLVEEGVTEPDDLLKERMTALKVDRDQARTALARARTVGRPAVDINPIDLYVRSGMVPVDISPIIVERFGQMMREKLTSGEVPFRKAYLGTIVDRVEVDDHEIRIVGRKDVLEQAVLANGGPIPGVRSFVRKWRTGEDSNSRPPDS